MSAPQPTTMPAAAVLRKPQQVMRLARLGCFHQTRLSFMRGIVRDAATGNWTFSRALWEVDDRGVGRAVYTVTIGRRTYSLVCFAHDLPPEQRSDRVIAEAWDATFNLFDGVPSDGDLDRLSKNTPRQEAGHYTRSELVLARANRSVRLFEYVTDCLARGEQPALPRLDEVGYLMRTTAVYGNGKFGISDRECFTGRSEMRGAFRAELLAVWLIRWFTVDIVEHLARVQGGDRAVSLSDGLRRRLGVGNSTGLGMAPFLSAHPKLIHHWVLARETALARVRALDKASRETQAAFCLLLSRMMLSVESWKTADARQQKRIARLKSDLLAVNDKIVAGVLDQPRPWNALINWSEGALDLEGQELLVSLVIEPHGECVDELADTMTVDEHFTVDGGRSCADTLQACRQRYGWISRYDFSQQSATARFWYVSEEKLEPRLGERYVEAGADKEYPLTHARDMAEMVPALTAYCEAAGGDEPVAAFLLKHPRYRHCVRRLQLVEAFPYGEIQDNLIDEAIIPIDMLRCKLSFFGASRFDPKSDRWVRINMYQYAPFPLQVHDQDWDDWPYPPL